MTSTPSDDGFVIDQDSTPYTHLNFKNDPYEFQFAILSDNSGGGRPGVFEAGAGMLNLLQPEFVVGLGDLVEGYTSPSGGPATEDDYRGWWAEIDEYLELVLRVKTDPSRAAAVLRTLLARRDLSPAMRTNVEAWVADLDALDAPAAGSRVAQAREHISRAESRSRYPNDRLGLVHYVAASGLLNRESSTSTSAGPELAEVYYLQGLIESRIGRSFWLSETEFLLETAIELDPSGPHAENAYALLEEFTISGYSGSDGAHVPEDVQRRLDALRESINRQ